VETFLFEYKYMYNISDSVSIKKIGKLSFWFMGCAQKHNDCQVSHSSNVIV
jgi:hypothetical protein